MATHTSTEPIVRRHFEQEWQRRLRGPDVIDAAMLQQLGPIESLATHMVDLITEFHDRPAADLGPVVRRILAERDFVDENGDSVVDQQMLDNLDRQVDLILDVLENVRKRCLDEGQWSNLPVTPQMFG